MTCPHHWTVTSECPQCLRALYDGACARVRSLQEDKLAFSVLITRVEQRAERAEAERDVLYKLALTMYSGKHIQDTIDAALREPRD